MNKQEITALALSLVSKHLPSDWKFEWNNRKAALGLCNYTKKTIYLSKYFLGRVDHEELKDTILHEIAHALAFIRYGHRGHGIKWKVCCVEIGAKPQRCYGGEVKNEDAQYTVKCPCCDYKFARHRFNKAKLTQLKNGYSWFNCKCKKSRMDIYKGKVKIVDGNAAKRPASTRKPLPKKMTINQLVALTRQTR